MISDEELYRRLLAGDESSLEALVHRYHSPILGFLYRQTGNRHTAEDLTQECFARLIGYGGEPPRRFKPWAFAIAANLARDHFRSAYNRRERPSEFAQPELLPVQWEAGADELLMRKADRREVVDGLQQLSPNHREVLILRFYHEMRVDEIAEVVGAPVGTVKSRLFHALRHLKEHLIQKGGITHEAGAHR